jgi:tripeptide aminopeptidase
MINKARVLETFLDYVRTDSVSGHEKAMGEKLLAELQALGLEVHKDEAGKKSGSGDGFNVYGRLKGTIPGKPILLSAHMDTMPPGNGIKPIVKDGLITSDGSTVLGGDDKSGIAAIVEAIRSILEQGVPHHSFEVVFSIGEETGMKGAKNMDYDWFQSSQAIIFDTGGPQGKIVTEGPGQLKIKATVHGRKSHAGLAPEKGISAIQVAAKGVAAMNLLRIDEETTCNLGTFTCDVPTNVVPDRVDIFGEIRSRNKEKLEAQARHMKECLQKACDEAGATLDCEIFPNYAAFKVSNEDPFVRRIAAAYDAIGARAETVKGGGGSDANVMALHGITPVIVSTGMAKVHTTEEELKVRDLEDTSEFVYFLLTK